MTQKQKLEWLRKHNFEVDKFTESGQVTWEAWDTLDSGGYFIAMPTKNEAVNEAYEYLKDVILKDFNDLLDTISFSARTTNWKNFEIGMDKLRALILDMDK